MGGVQRRAPINIDIIYWLLEIVAIRSFIFIIIIVLVIGLLVSAPRRLTFLLLGLAVGIGVGVKTGRSLVGGP